LAKSVLAVKLRLSKWSCDLALTRRRKTKAIERVGEEPTDRIAELWPSDHAREVRPGPLARKHRRSMFWHLYTNAMRHRMAPTDHEAPSAAEGLDAGASPVLRALPESRSSGMPANAPQARGNDDLACDAQSAP
jgi:hypothetical protein